MTRGGNSKSAGFTIVETLIVLAVSATIATSTLLLFAGRQNKTQFQVAANSLKQQLEQIINETANGYYPDSNDFTCDIASGSIVISTATTTKQGQNYNCTFLGKALAFGVPPTSSSQASESFIAYPLIGRRYVSGTTNEPQTFAQATPIALAPDGLNSATNPSTPPIDHSVAYTTENGLSLNHAQYVLASPGPSVPAKKYAVFALADDLSQYQIDSNGNLNSAVQKLSLFNYDYDAVHWPLPPPSSSALTVGYMNRYGIDTTDISAVQLCFSSGGTQQSAQLTISGHGQLTVTLQIFGDNTTCT